MANQEYHDLRTFIELAKAVDEYHVIEGADWDREIGALTEVTAELSEPPLLIFDRIKGYKPGFRVVSNLMNGTRRSAVAYGLPVDLPKLDLIRLAAAKLQDAKPIPPQVLPTGPVMENVLTGDDVDMWLFPTPFHHAGDGGRFIGTGDTVINRDPDSGYVNMGTYRVQVHDKNTLGLWTSPGQQAKQICQKYWERGQSCPVAVTFGGDPLAFVMSTSKLPWGHSEMDMVGGFRGRPLEVVTGPVTGLPIPAHAEIAIEGEIPPPSVESRPEGPFGEWPGYYSGGTVGTGENQPIIRVKALYYRNNPILLDWAPMWPGAPTKALPIEAGILWNQLERAGVQDITAVFQHSHYMQVVAIKQRYPGHAKQAGLAVLGCAMAARNGRYVVVVDDDIDVTNLREVHWAMETRVDPATNIDLIDGCWSTPLDPRVPPDKRANGDHTNSRAIYYAVRPFHWRDKFPKSARVEPKLRQEVVSKYKSVLPGLK